MAIPLNEFIKQMIKDTDAKAITIDCYLSMIGGKVQIVPENSGSRISMVIVRKRRK